jgi:hypothetical protein
MSLRPDRETQPGMPRWVKVLGIIIILSVVLFVIVHLLGGGFRGHALALEIWRSLP